MIEQSDSLRCSPRRPFHWPTAIPNEAIIDDSAEIKRHVETRKAVATIRKMLDQMRGPGTFQVLGVFAADRRSDVCEGDNCECIYCCLDRIESHTVDVSAINERVTQAIR